jgi:hypothetical protein
MTHPKMDKTFLSAKCFPFKDIEMGEEVPKEPLPLEQNLKEFFQEVPAVFSTFQQGIQSEKIRFVYFQTGASKGEEIPIDYFPFQTIFDLRAKLSIALSKKLGTTLDPNQISLLVPNREGTYVSLSNIFRIKSKEESKVNDEIKLNNPFVQAASKPSEQFIIPASGEPRAVENNDLSRMLIEDVIYNRFGTLTEVHVFTSPDVIASIPSAVPVPYSTSQWIGKLYPYFDRLSVNEQATGGVSESQREFSKNYAKYILYSDKLLAEYDRVLGTYSKLSERVDLEKYRLHFLGVKYLKLRWKKPDVAKDVELLFYELPVTKVVPFMRIISPDKEPITKVLIKPFSIQKIPDIEPAKLFLDWATEESATPEADFLYAKTLYHEKADDEPMNMYGTMRFTADRTAAYILVPPKQKRYLESRRHLNKFPELLAKALEKTPYATMVPDVHKMSVICGIRLHIKDKPLTLERLRARVEALSYFFQEIKPLPGSNALITLRYKPISNFQTDDRIHQFIKQVEERFGLTGSDENIKEMARYLMREFGITFQDAISRIQNFYTNKIDLVPIDTDAKDFIAKYNYGIDIVVKASHPLYTFDIYGLESESTFRRLLTSLSLLFGTRSKEWIQAQKIYLAFDRATTAEVKKPTTTIEEDEAAAWRAMMGDAGDEDTSIGDAAPQEEEEDFTFEFVNEQEVKEENERGGLPLPADTVTAEQQFPREVKEKEKEKEEVYEENTETEGELEVAEGTKKSLKAQESKKKSTKKDDNPLAEYFLKRLKQADETLFVFKTDTGKDYSGLCQANVMKQPLVMSESQFELLISKQGKQRFVRYGINPETGQPFQDQPPVSGEYITVMAYGSSPANIKYYLCPQYFCYKDELVLFKEDLESLRDKKGNPKPKNTCPFCGGTVIAKSHRKNPGFVKLGDKMVEETIFDRWEFRTPNDQIHDEVGFLRKKAELHPSKKFWIPCCFIAPPTTKKRGEDIQPTGKAYTAYEHLFKQTKKPEAAPIKTQPFISYKIVLDKPETRYIQGSTKFPLNAFSAEGPQIGLLFPKLDEYFQQNPNNMVARDFTKSKLQPNGEGFLRLGVQNGRQYLNDSFFSVLAPYLNETSIDGVKQRLIQEIVRKPKVFLNLNYGNLMIEFYNADIPIPETTTVIRGKETVVEPFSLETWARENLQMNYTDTNKLYIQRIFKSLINFEGYIESPDRLKEYRHFAHFLSSPLPITQNRGILFLIIDYNADETMTVRCPPFGYDEEKHRICDYGILIHHYSGYWEPIFYVANRASTSTSTAFSRSDLLFQAIDETSRDPQHAWPPILRKRINEFRMNCVSSLKTSLFTVRSAINPASMIPITAAIDILTGSSLGTTAIFNGVIKDIYNHTVGITIQTYDQQKYIALPVVDDGKITYFNMQLYLDWDQFEPAPADRVFAFYQDVVATKLPAFEGYRVKYKVVSVNDNNLIMALQLANGIFIPTNPTEQSKLPMIEARRINDYKEFISSMEYSINKSVFFAEEKGIKGREQLITLQQNDLEEIYQHLRYMFGNWITSRDETVRAPSDVSTKIIDTVSRRDLPLFEKRQRLYLTIGNIVENWLYQDDYKIKPVESLLRIDCRIQDEDTCSGRCKWKTAEELGQTTGQCYLHAPEKGLVGGTIVNALKLFTFRLIDELLRFPEKRKQLLETGVPGLIHLTDAVTLKDNQYIVPEHTLAWDDLWRMDWAPKEKEEARYYEEMSVQPERPRQAIPTDVPPPPKKKLFKIRALPGALPRLEELRIGEPDVVIEEEEVPTTPKAEAPEVKRKARFFKVRREAIEAITEPAPVPVLQPTEEAPPVEGKKGKFKVREPGAKTQVVPPPPPPPPARELEPVREATPVVKELTPVREATPVKEATPVVKEATPVREATPLVKELTPVKEATPVREATPVVKELTPVKEVTPVVKELTPIREATPVVKELTPIREATPKEATPPIKVATPKETTPPMKEPTPKEATPPVKVATPKEVTAPKETSGENEDAVGNFQFINEEDGY